MTSLPGRDDDGRAPALDHAGGIARLMGDELLFARVLARFRNDYRHSAAGIRQALGKGDLPLALRLVHTLKGAAGMIEAVPLGRAALALEQVLHLPDHGGGEAWQGLARLEGALERVLKELDATAATTTPVPHANGAAPGGAGGGENDDETLRRLAALLADGNGEAVDLVRDAASALAAQLGEQRYRRLADTVEAFDFDGALALLAAWA